MISYFIFIFWDAVIYVRKPKYDFNKTHAIKAKYKLLVIASIYNFLYGQVLYFTTYLFVFGIQLFM